MFFFFFLKKAELLINSGADVNSKTHLDISVLRRAIDQLDNGGSLEVVEMLIDHGANVNGVAYSEWCGYTFLHKTIMNGVLLLDLFVSSFFAQEQQSFYQYTFHRQCQHC